MVTQINLGPLPPNPSACSPGFVLTWSHPCTSQSCLFSPIDLTAQIGSFILWQLPGRRAWRAQLMSRSSFLSFSTSLTSWKTRMVREIRGCRGLTEGNSQTQILEKRMELGWENRDNIGETQGLGVGCKKTDMGWEGHRTGKQREEWEGYWFWGQEEKARDVHLRNKGRYGRDIGPKSKKEDERDIGLRGTSLTSHPLQDLIWVAFN